MHLLLNPLRVDAFCVIWPSCVGHVQRCGQTHNTYPTYITITVLLTIARLHSGDKKNSQLNSASAITVCSMPPSIVNQLEAVETVTHAILVLQNRMSKPLCHFMVCL